MSSDVAEFAWLPAGIRRWAIEHREVLEAVYAHFHETGRWPDPVQLQRELRAKSEIVALARRVNEMPRELGWRNYSPPSVVLTLFGVACSPASRHLLRRYVEVLHLALARHDSPELDNRLSRDHVVSALGLDPVEADRLSKLLLADCPFLGGGHADVEDWDLTIDERVVDFETIGSIDEFLLVLRAQRFPAQDGTPRAPHRTPPRSNEVAEQPHIEGLADSSRVAPQPQKTASLDLEPQGVNPTHVAVAALAIGGNVVALVLAPPALGVAVATATLVAWIVSRRRPTLRVARLALLSLACAAVTGTITFFTIGANWPHRASLASLDDQIDQIVREAAQEKKYPVVRRKVLLHGSEVSSHLFVFRDAALLDPLHSDLVRPLSDELRIYDEDEGELKLRLRFQAQNGGEIAQPPEGDHPSFLFRLGSIADYDRDGKKEITGTFERATLVTGPFPVPVLIGWNAETQRYGLYALVQQPPDLRTPPRTMLSLSPGYQSATTLQNQHANQIVKAVAVSDFTVFPTATTPLLVAAFSFEGPTGYSGTYEVKAWRMELESTSPILTSCGMPPSGHRYLRPESALALGQAMRRAFLHGTCSET